MKNIIHRVITSKNIKENSYLAIKKAIKNKESIGVEFDIRLTKDKKIVLSHNSLINLNVIEETNYSELIKNNYLTTLDKILDIDTNKIFLIDISPRFTRTLYWFAKGLNTTALVEVQISC